MKKIFSILLLVLMLGLISAPVAVAAADTMVIDLAKVLTEKQVQALNERAVEISLRYECETYIITLPDMADFGFTDPMDFSEYVFRENNLGYGPDRSCVVLLLSMAGRDYDLGVWGFGKTAFTEHGKDVILVKHILPLLRDDKYHEAFGAYLNQTEEYLKMAREGRPFDRDTDPAELRKAYLTKLGVVIILPLLVALGLCLMWVNQMKTAKIALKADQYIPAGGFTLTGQQDTFLYRTVMRIKINTKGGSSRIGGSGGMHRSGKF